MTLPLHGARTVDVGVEWVVAGVFGLDGALSARLGDPVAVDCGVEVDAAVAVGWDPPPPPPDPAGDPGIAGLVSGKVEVEGA